MLRTLIVTVIAVVIGPLAYADDRPGASAPPPARWSSAVETTGEIHREAWNYNLSDEDLFGGSAAIWYPLSPTWSIGQRLLVLWVHQERVPSTPLAGTTLLLRRYFHRPHLTYFVEGGGGMSYAARFVPQRGTRFNYIAEASAGVVHATSRYAHFVVSFRFLHLSNNGLAGSARNPDIEAFGIRMGVQLPLSPAP
jgi:hypothetical protein